MSVWNVLVRPAKLAPSAGKSMWTFTLTDIPESFICFICFICFGYDRCRLQVAAMLPRNFEYTHCIKTCVAVAFFESILWADFSCQYFHRVDVWMTFTASFVLYYFLHTFNDPYWPPNFFSKWPNINVCTYLYMRQWQHTTAATSATEIRRVKPNNNE